MIAKTSTKYLAKIKVVSRRKITSKGNNEDDKHNNPLTESVSSFRYGAKFCPFDRWLQFTVGQTIASGVLARKQHCQQQ